MDNEEARFLLSACRPSGEDAQCPEIADALAQAQRDPELADWLARERRSDGAISRKLRELEPPAALRARLLAGGRASRHARGWRTWRAGLGLAASITLAAGVAWWAYAHWFAPTTSMTVDASSLLAWQQNCVGVFANPFFQLDLEQSTYEPLEAHLVARQARVAGELPFNNAIVSAVGCKVLASHGAVLSLTCFRSDTGELVHLFVGPRNELDEAVLQRGPHRAQVGGFATVTWMRGDLVVMVASKLTAEELERTLRTERLVMVDARFVPQA